MTVENTVLTLVVLAFFGVLILWGFGSSYCSYSRNDPRLNVECPKCGCEDIVKCGHHD